MASILIVDDDAPIRALLRRILEEDGHQIREASNGEIGLRLYRDAPADLVITDIMMPERDGMEVTLALTQEFLDARVIAITGGTGDQNFLNVAKLFGARRVIQKPFTPREVRRAVLFVLNH
ncbi:MAG: Response regulator [Candidatus Nitrospira kreftii]|jgi:CheY-like chemotaxis protein|uniref:Response regulator n=1 Tax=Candidatus Nitrospira kreftii TaxID=2652173 RepID=A0A7S8J133_9BACT|nr:MAG: Response regulator [Candidatus Nitrospira kreftii]